MTGTNTGGPVGGQARATYGFIATIRNQTTGERISRPYHGEQAPADGTRNPRITVDVVDLLQLLAGDIDAMDGDWRVQTLSSPASIYGDITGRAISEHQATPEEGLMGRINRGDLVEAQPKTEHGQRRQVRRQRARRDAAA